MPYDIQTQTQTQTRKGRGRSKTHSDNDLLHHRLWDVAAKTRARVRFTTARRPHWRFEGLNTGAAAARVRRFAEAQRPALSPMKKKRSLFASFDLIDLLLSPRASNKQELGASAAVGSGAPADKSRL